MMEKKERPNMHVRTPKNIEIITTYTECLTSFQLLTKLDRKKNVNGL